MKQLSRLLGAALMVGTLCVCLSAQEKQPTPAPEKGPAVGEKLPTFRARDQFGHEQTPATLTGARGFVLLFFRSADW
jgi:hypothetical protein